MRSIALSSAEQGRLRPSFFFACAVLGGAGWSVGVSAQQAVFRCGQQYTNVPQDASRCERVAPQAITVIEGTRVQAGARAAAPAAAPAVSPSSVSPSSASADATQGPAAASLPREDMARQILSAELAQARERHTQSLQAYREAQAEAAPEPSADRGARLARQERLDRLQASVARAQRDIDSLQRELLRRPPPSVAP